MSFVDLLGYAALASLPLFVVSDFVAAARRFERPRFFRLQAAAFTVFNFYFALYLGGLYASWFPGASLLPGAALGTWGGALAGILVYEFVHYWYHRTAHRSDWLWRATHQMHHAPESVETLGAFYLHPLDNALFTAWATLVFVPFLGLTPEAAGVASAFLTFNAVFQHANIRTPRWLGYLIQRPESHGVHHERGVHAYNYSDLPLWDIVFGTFRNPERWDGQAGFYDGASNRVGAMLVGRDVSRPAGAEASGEKGLRRPAVAPEAHAA
jgi:sterol desaturase/sphingolipid hydroxylase (fatty acid hydroxylase superfamily)